MVSGVYTAQRVRREVFIPHTGCDSAASQHNVHVQPYKHTHISLLVKRGIQPCIDMLLVLALCLLCACCSIMLVLNGCVDERMNRQSWQQYSYAKSTKL
jgi:hypothetical protein